MNQAIVGALRAAGLTGSDLVAIGVTNQRETTVVWNPRDGRPWHNAIVWQDTRTDAAVTPWKPKHALIWARTGLPPATYFSATKLQWILDHVDGARAAAERGEALFGTIDSWIIWHLTGGADGGLHVTDVTNASRTLLMSLQTREWDEELLALFRIPRRMLPRICRSSDPSAFGVTRASGPVGVEVPISGNLGDQHAAMVGQTCFTSGEAKNTYGTGNFILLNTGPRMVPSTSGLITTIAYALEDADTVVRTRGVGRGDGVCRAMAARSARGHPDRGRNRKAGRERAEQCGSVFRAGLLWAVRAVLARGCPWRHRGPDAFPYKGPSRTRNTRGHLLSDPRSAGRDGAGLWHTARSAQG